MLEGIGTALASLVTTNQTVVRPIGAGMQAREPAAGFAAAAVIKATPGAHGSSPRLEARAVVIGVQRRDGYLADAEIPDAMLVAWGREAALDAYETVASRLAGSEPGTAAPPPAIRREDVWVANPVEAYRTVLGDARTRALEAGIAERWASMQSRSSDSLTRRRVELGDPFQHLDVRTAYELLSAEHGSDAANARVRSRGDDDGFHTLMAGVEADRLEDIQQAARVEHDEIERNRERLRRHTQAVRDLAQRAGHPQRWLDGDHGRQAAEQLAIDWELAHRAEVGVADAIERAIADPPPHVRDALGPPPDDLRERICWEGLARDVAWVPLAAARSDRDTNRANRSELDRRVDEWRGAQGMQPLGRRARERDADPDIGM